MPKNEQPIIFTTPEFAQQGRDLAEQTGGELGNDFLQNQRFRDGWPHGHIRDVARSVQDRHVFWLGDYSRPENFFQNMTVPAAMAAYGAKILHVVCPFFPVGTMERVEKEGDIVTAIIMMRFFGNLPQADERKNRLTIFDIHQLGERHYLPREMAWRGLSWMQYINEKLPKDAVIAFPDEGAWKRFGKMFPGKRVVEFKKMRNKLDPTGKKKDLTVIEGQEHIRNENVYLVDDLIMTGGTSMEGGRILFEYGAKTVTAVAPHSVFPDDNFDEFLSVFDGYLTSDTVPLQAAKLAQNPKATVHSIVPILAESINQ